MKKLIEIEQDILIQCDNPECDFSVPNETKDPFADTVDFINKPCPKCGENLLTEQDQKDALRFLRLVAFVNKWFSWLTIFSFKNKKQNVTSVHIHNGINIKKNKNG